MDDSFDHMGRSPASLAYVIGTALLAGVACAAFAVFAARALGVSSVIAGATTGIVAAAIVGAVLRRHGRPSGL